MKSLILILFSTLLFAKAPLSVKHVDPQKFSGLWYEIARTYNSYEKDCVAATVEYTLQEDNKSYEVHNRCFDKVIGAKLIEYKGTAEATTPNAQNSIANLDMTYYYIFTQSYKIIYLEADYSLAIIVDDAMEQVWIMSRSPKISKEKLDTMLNKLKPYMKLEELIFTPQDIQGRYQ
ncbi:MAG: Outer membrane lipoprotein Blc [uncultured Sulfurovum sp.]|uniref:Outer membrane lipoprotein Blc n=1 Tax=uncultured Sulfurovum sp. TaxID=269237 RepID=A0A6S6SJR4_9BACT|nr:MAG: Outer membrane lipoprotein Blc [uncultured Sulfurovum sp.]